MADVILVVGSNTTEAHPIIAIELKKAARRGTRIIVVDPRRIKLVDHASRWLRIKPGTNVLLFNALMRAILDAGLQDDAFIAERTEGFEELRSHLAGVDIEQAADLTGIPAADIRATAEEFASAGAASIVYCMGVTQHASGTDQVRALADLSMIAGQIGRPGTGMNPLRGQNNVQGACDLACLPNCLPGYQSVTDRGALDRACDLWATDHVLSEEPGLTIIEMFDGAIAGSLKAMYIMGENPLVADPDIEHVREALAALEFLVVQDIFLTETAAMADVVFPAATFLEKHGTFTNSERRVQLAHPVVEAPGDALPDLDILISLARALGLDWEYDGPSDVMIEMGAVTPQYGGITYRRLREEGSLQWPCPDADHPGTPILHTTSFPRGKGAFAAIEYIPPAEETSAELMFMLGTGRHLWNFHSNTMTGHSEGLNALNPEGYLEISPEDAESLCVCEGDMLEISSPRATVTAPARITAGLRPGVVFMPFHFAARPANALTTGAHRDPYSKIPALKTTPVSVRRVDGA